MPTLIPEQIAQLVESLPDGPYFVNFDDGSDCPNHANSGLAVVDTGRESDWPVARHCHWPVAKVIALLPGLLETLAGKDARCSICKVATDMACADCQILLSATIYVCAKSACRDEHEINCPRHLKNQADTEMERVKACEHIAEGDEGWQQLTNLCPSTAAVASLRAELQQKEAEIRRAIRNLDGGNDCFDSLGEVSTATNERIKSLRSEIEQLLQASSAQSNIFSAQLHQANERIAELERQLKLWEDPPEDPALSFVEAEEQVNHE